MGRRRHGGAVERGSGSERLSRWLPDPRSKFREACSTSSMPDEPQTPDKLQAKQLRGGEIYRQPGSRFRDRSRANNSGNLTSYSTFSHQNLKPSRRASVKRAHGSFATSILGRAR